MCSLVQASGSIPTILIRCLLTWFAIPKSRPWLRELTVTRARGVTPRHFSTWRQRETTSGLAHACSSLNSSKRAKSPGRLERIRQPRRGHLQGKPCFSQWSGSPDENHDAGELGKRVEVASVAFIASDESSEAHHPGEEPFDVPTPAIAAQRATVLGLGLSSGVVGCDHLNAIVSEVTVEFVAIVGAVSDELFRERLYESRGKRAVDELRFMALTARSPYGDRKAMTVCHCHDLGRFAASSDPNFKAPLFAPACVPSMNASVKSIFPRS
jgi:hypothetical protein